MQVLFQLFVSEFGRVWAGLIDAAAARAQLGLTSTGSAVATATDPAAARTAIGLGTMATQNANAVAITGGTGAFTGAISTTDTTESTSTTTGSIRGAGAGFTGNLYVGGLTSIQGVTLEKINSLLYTPTQKRGIVTNDLSLSLGTIGVSVNHPSPESIVGRFDFFHTAGDQGILVEGGGNVRGWIFYVLQNELWWHAGDAANTGDIPGRFEGSVLIEPGLNTVEFYFSVSQESKVFLNGRLVAQKQITMTSIIHFGADNMYLWGSSVPPGSWPVNYLPPELVTSYPIGSKGLFAYAFDLSLDLLPAVDPAAARTAIGLGTMATQNANAVAITGGTGAFTGPISTADTTESTSTTTGSIRGAGAGFTGNVSAASFNEIQQSRVGSSLRWGDATTAPAATGSFWIAQGVGAGFSSTTGGNWIAQGVNAGRNNTSGSFWIAQGASAGFSSTTGGNWIAQGVNAGRNNTDGSFWIAQGASAGFSSTTGGSWIAQGVNAGRNNTDGSGWIAQGFEAGYNRQGSNWWIVSNSRNYDFIYGEMDNNNLSLMKAGDGFSGGSGVLKLPVATTVPTSNPTSGFLVYQKPTGEVCVRDQSGEKAVTGANAGAFTGPISTTDTTASTSTTTGAIRAVGGISTQGRLNVGADISAQNLNLSGYIGGGLIKQSRALPPNAIGQGNDRLAFANILYTVTSGLSSTHLGFLFDRNYQSGDALFPVGTTVIEIDFSSAWSFGAFSFMQGIHVFYTSTGWLNATMTIEVQQNDNSWVTVVNEAPITAGSPNIFVDTANRNGKGVRYSIYTEAANSRARLLEYYPTDTGMGSGFYLFGHKEQYNAIQSVSSLPQAIYSPDVIVASSPQSATSAKIGSGRIESSLFVRPGTHTVAQLQAGLTGQTAGATAYCSNESGGAVPVFFDGTNWRRESDRQPISSAAVGRRFYFEDGSYLQPNANGDLVFTSKNNNPTTMALA